MRLIDAEPIEKAIDEWLARETKDPVTQTIVDNVGTWVTHAPTIEAIPVKHGKFIGTEYDGYADGNPVYYEWECSECGCIFEDDEPTYNYCPNCGARMDG